MNIFASKFKRRDILLNRENEIGYLKERLEGRMSRKKENEKT